MTEKKSLMQKIRQSRHSYFLMAPFMLFCFLFVILPVLISFILSFTNFNMLEWPSFVGFENYIRMILDDKILLIALKNTIIFALLTGTVSYVLCFMLAWLINDLGRTLRNVFTVIFYAPSMCASVYVVWTFIFSNDAHGFINGFLMNLGFLSEPVKWLADQNYIMTVLIIVQLWMSLGTGFLAFIAGLQGVDHGLYEAGAIDGIHNRFEELWYITLPQMLPQLTFGAIMQIIGAFGAGQISMALAGFPSTNYAGETVITHIIDYGTVRYEMGYACALATILFLMMFFTQKGVVKVLSKIGG